VFCIEKAQNCEKVVRHEAFNSSGCRRNRTRLVCSVHTKERLVPTWRGNRCQVCWLFPSKNSFCSLHYDTDDIWKQSMSCIRMYCRNIKCKFFVISSKQIEFEKRFWSCWAHVAHLKPLFWRLEETPCKNVKLLLPKVLCWLTVKKTYCVTRKIDFPFKLCDFWTVLCLLSIFYTTHVIQNIRRYFISCVLLPVCRVTADVTAMWSAVTDLLDVFQVSISTVLITGDNWTL
jgi:hypothetical protein